MKGAAADALAGRLSRALDQATYEGYAAGFIAARDHAAALAQAAGDATLARAIAALRPLPDRTREAPGRG
jgi:hypothetical protein